MTADQILDYLDLLDLVAAAVNLIVAVAVLSARLGGGVWCAVRSTRFDRGTIAAAICRPSRPP